MTDKARSRRAVADETWARSLTGLRVLIERLTPWLLDLGNWIFGALIAFNLLLLGSLLTVGPVDKAILVATAALALALPVDVAGFLLLRLITDLKSVNLEELARSAFVEAGFSVTESAALDQAEVEKRRARVVLLASYALLALAVLLTVVGVTAALWHMAWWIGLLFVVIAVVSQAVVFIAFTATGRGRRQVWTSPSEGAEKH